jgi:hypothetical protein
MTDGPLPCEPYHAAQRIDFALAEGFIRQASERAREMAAEWIKSVAEGLGDRQLTGVGLVLGSGRPDFTLRQAVATHAATHNAEGWLFREALMRASEECGLGVAGALETAVYEPRGAGTGAGPRSWRTVGEGPEARGGGGVAGAGTAFVAGDRRANEAIAIRP